MRVSQFEIYRLVQRALESLGAGYGVDRDGARSVAWLEARGLPGLASLAHALGGLERDLAPPPLRSEGSRLVIGAAGRSAIAFAGAAMDLLRESTAGDGAPPTMVIVEQCASPLFLLPVAAAEATPSRAYAMAWRGSAGNVAIRIQGDGELTIYLSQGADAAAAFADHAPIDIEVANIVLGVVRAPIDHGLVPAIDGRELAARLERSLDGGIEVDPALWARIEQIAARVQVPASAVSRVKGAGGGDANA